MKRIQKIQDLILSWVSSTRSPFNVTNNSRQLLLCSQEQTLRIFTKILLLFHLVPLPLLRFYPQPIHPSDKLMPFPFHPPSPQPSFLTTSHYHHRHFIPYISAPTPFNSSQPYSTPLFHQLPYPQTLNIPSLPPFRIPKLELTMFDGTNPLNWLFQVDQFFSFYNLSPENRLSLISFYMKGDALSWFKWMHQNHFLTDWFSFVRALKLRFGPSTYDNNQVWQPA